ncbi:MAG: cadherin-like domain-containing protein [Planctomycetota bacterium]
MKPKKHLAKRTLGTRLQKLEPRCLLAAVLVGDFNGDQAVDVADYTVWRDSHGSQVAAFSGADASGNGVVDAADHQLWIGNFGATAGQLAAPQLVANSLQVTRGAAVVLSESHLSASDADTLDSDLVYSLAGVAGGRFERVSSPGQAVTSFSQSEITGRAVRFVHDNSMTAPSFRVSVSDGTSMTTPLAASVTFSHGHTHTPGLEFQSVLNLVTDAQATHRVAQSGAWSDPTVWENGQLPGAGARIVIPDGLSVTVDSQLAPEFETLRIDGTLRFATDVNTRLKVDTLVSKRDGLLEVGTAAIPIRPDVTAEIVFADDGAIDRAVDPNLLSRGAILHGKTTVYGAAKTAWTSLAQQPRAGATQLVLSQAPSGWRVGDEIVVAGTDPNDPASDEVVRIASIDGATISLASALTKDHVAPQAELEVHVANNTRNVVFTSENADVKRRGHVMFMHTLDVDLNYALFYQLGRTDKSIPLNDFQWPDLQPGVFETLGGDNVRGRYSVHFHRGGTDPSSTPAKVHGSVVNDDPGWAYVNHSANVDFTENVSYNILGSAYNTEAGDEIGSFINNIAIRTYNPAEPLSNPDSDNPFLNAPDGRERQQDYGWQGDGFWFHGPHVTVQGNVVSGASGHAYIWWPEGLLEPTRPKTFFDSANLPNGHLLGPPGTQVEIYDVPIISFDNNQAYSATRGIQFYYLHTDGFGGGEPWIEEEAPLFNYRSQLNSTLSNSTVWATSQAAVDAPYASRLTFDGLKLVGTGAPGSVGLNLGHFLNQAWFNFNNLDVSGFETGLIAPLGGEITINGGTYGNVTDLEIKNPERVPRRLTINNLNFVDLPSSLAGKEADRQNIRMTASFDEFGADDTDKHALFVLLPDQVLLNYGPYQNQQLYYSQQAANSVATTVDNPAGGSGRVPPQYVGKSNGQLASQFNLAFGGALLPDGAAAASGISGGLVGPVSDRMSVPPFIAENGEVLDPLPDVPPPVATATQAAVINAGAAAPVSRSVSTPLWLPVTPAVATQSIGEASSVIESPQAGPSTTPVTIDQAFAEPESPDELAEQTDRERESERPRPRRAFDEAFARLEVRSRWRSLGR